MTVESAYIRESPRPDCDPAHRYRLTRLDGTMAYFAGRVEADRALRAILRAPQPGEAARPSPFAAELEVYRARLDELLGPGDVNEGRRVVIKGDVVLGPFDDLDGALEAAYDRFGLGGFLVKKLERVETVHYI